ncbi:MAG: Ldh family oxidoreductase, partial [Rhodospirillaceae bacterium]|nr:Ldh family oxidoreductase [Rhodospirillaceae bacterium]
MTSDNNDGVGLSLAEVADLTRRVLIACGTGPANAESVVDSVVAAEADGIHSHGLARLPTYAEHVLCGKVDGKAQPGLSLPRPGAVVVDAACGFAHPAIDLGLASLVEAARDCGVAAMTVTNSYNCGVAGYHVERIAQQGMLALGFVNAPAAIAPWGGKKGVFGTDPIAIGCPRGDLPPLVLDQSSSVIAKSEVMVHAQKGEPIPEGWAFDA